VSHTGSLFRAAAQATGCRVEINVDETMCDLRQNAVLSREYVNTIKESYGMTTNTVEGAIGGSTGKMFVHNHSSV
jgi:hypothetical protein